LVYHERKELACEGSHCRGYGVHVDVAREIFQVKLDRVVGELCGHPDERHYGQVLEDLRLLEEVFVSNFSFLT
jgi:hypothetical protein